MGRTFAGVLGYLAFVVVVFRGFLQAGSVEQTIEWALVYLFVFAVFGYIFGELAAWFVGESVRARLERRVQTSKEAAAAGTVNRSR